MEIDWNIVKKMTLWNYEDLIKKIREVLSYNFIQEHYNHSMKEAETYAQKLLGYDQKYEECVNKIKGIFRKLDSSRIENYNDLVHKVQNREKCRDFLEETNLPFKDLVSVSNHILRIFFQGWRAPAKQLSV